MDTRWQSTQMDCDKCGYEWAAVHPAVCEYLECPVCGHMTPAPPTPNDPKTEARNNDGED